MKIKNAIAYSAIGTASAVMLAGAVSQVISAHDARGSMAENRVVYTGNHFAPESRDAIFTSIEPTAGGPAVLEAYQYLEPGDVLDILGDDVERHFVGTPLVRVRRMSDGYEGLVTLTTATAELRSADVQQISYGDSILFPTVALSREGAEAAFERLRGDYLQFYSSDGGVTVHPAQVGLDVLQMLLFAVSGKGTESDRARAVETASVFFERYGFPDARQQKSGVGWPYQFDWALPWGIHLRAPWYSGYANGVMAVNAALMADLTGESRYRQLAESAVDWMLSPVDQGGALYRSDGMEYIAEYAYGAGLPQIRVFDGEMKAVLCLFNTAIVLRDQKLLMRSRELASNLRAALPLMSTADGKILNARYPWLVDNKDYVTWMKLWANQLGAILHDRSVAEVAARWQVSPTVW